MDHTVPKDVYDRLRTLTFKGTEKYLTVNSRSTFKPFVEYVRLVDGLRVNFC